MCGITGVVKINRESLEEDNNIAAMTGALRHRGPDDEGFYFNSSVVLGFRRLSIIDLETGHQPIANEDKTIWVIFNGEIYNYRELREELILRGHQFETGSDTEVIVHSYEEFGLEFVQKFRGMFVFALWDERKHRLLLARDRLGQKPLFYTIQDGELAFASELKSLLQWPKLNTQLNRQALHDYLTFLYVPAPDCIFSGTFKLPPASILVLECETSEISIAKYWTLPTETEPEKSFSDWQEELRDKLTESVRMRLISDVPLGVFLSGGIDSAIVTGLMSQFISPVKAYSIGFRDTRFDESEFAAQTARHFGADFFSETIDADSMSPDDLRDLVWYMDEPFGDSSFLPTYWVSKTARSHVTVALSGDGGDELFCGYRRYRNFRSIEELSRRLGAILPVGEFSAGSLHRMTRNLLPRASEKFRQIEKACALGQLSTAEMMLALVSYFDEEDKARLYTKEWVGDLDGYTSMARFARQLDIPQTNFTNLERFMWRDIQTNMVDDALVKVDRASMACSLEVRSPFLDHEVVECAVKIPSKYKMHGADQKVILKEAFREMIPPGVLRRKKQGFEIPFSNWFQKKEWRDFLIDTINERSVARLGIFDPKYAVRLRDVFLTDPEAKHVSSSGYQLRHRIWILLVFSLWHEAVASKSERK